MEKKNINAYIKSPPMYMSNMNDCGCTVEEVKIAWLSLFPKKALEKSLTHKIYQKGAFAVCGYNSKLLKIYGVYDSVSDAEEAINLACTDKIVGHIYKKIIDFIIIDLKLGPITIPIPTRPTGTTVKYHESDPHSEFWNHEHFDLETSRQAVINRLLPDNQELKNINNKKYTDITTEMKIKTLS